MNTRTLLLAGYALVAGSVTIFAGPEAISSGKESKQVQMEQAAVCDPRWYFSLGGGADFDISDKNFASGFEYRTTGVIPGGIGLFSLRQRAPSLNWDDVFDTTWHAGGEIGYALTEHLEIFGAFNYAHADSAGFNDWGILRASSLRIGTFGLPIRVAFDDYDAFGGELGFRYFLLSRQARIRPYVAFSGGAAHVDSIDINAVVDARSIGGPDDAEFVRGDFYEDSWVGTAAAVLGVEANLTCHWALGVNGGVRYQSRLEESDDAFDRLRRFPGAPVIRRAVSTANDDAGDRWTVPVTGYVKFRF